MPHTHVCSNRQHHRHNCIQMHDRARDIGNASCGYVISSVSFAESFRGNSVEGGEDRGIYIEFIIQARRKGGKGCSIAQLLPFRESEFFLYVCLFFLLFSFSLSSSFVAGKWHYRYSICFFTHTLITLRTRNAARYFVSASAMNTDKDRSKCVPRIGQYLIYYSFALKLHRKR